MKKASIALRSILLLAFVALVGGCGGDSDGAGPGPGDGLRWPGEDWEVVDPASEGMDAAELDRAREYAFALGRNTQGVVVVRNGAIVAEWYAPGKSATSLATSWSAGKSFGSTLIGIAKDQGLIDSLDVPMGRFYPQWEGTPKADITLRRLL